MTSDQRTSMNLYVWKLKIRYKSLSLWEKTWGDIKNVFIESNNFEPFFDVFCQRRCSNLVFFWYSIWKVQLLSKITVHVFNRRANDTVCIRTVPFELGHCRKLLVQDNDYGSNRFVIFTSLNKVFPWKRK